MRVLICLVAGLLLAAPAAAQKTEPPGGGVTTPVAPITGLWAVTGANARDQTYWGVGILTGRTFSVAYQAGLVVYQVTPQDLIGRWSTMRGTRLLGGNWRRR